MIKNYLHWITINYSCNNSRGDKCVCIFCMFKRVTHVWRFLVEGQNKLILPILFGHSKLYHFQTPTTTMGSDMDFFRKCVVLFGFLILGVSTKSKYFFILKLYSLYKFYFWNIIFFCFSPKLDFHITSLFFQYTDRINFILHSF